MAVPLFTLDYYQLFLISSILPLSLVSRAKSLIVIIVITVIREVLTNQWSCQICLFWDVVTLRIEYLFAHARGKYKLELNWIVQDTK